MNSIIFLLKFKGVWKIMEIVEGDLMFSKAYSKSEISVVEDQEGDASLSPCAYFVIKDGVGFYPAISKNTI